MLQLIGGAVNWMRKRHVVVSLSIVYVEYMSTTQDYKEAIFLMKLSLEVGICYRSIKVQYGSNNVIYLTKSPTFHEKKKNIDIKYHFIRGMVEDGKVILEKVDTL
jgi:hypothetical protein